MLVGDYLLSSLVPSVGCSGSSNDLSKDSSLASFISDLEQDIFKSITKVCAFGRSSCFSNFVINYVSSNTMSTMSTCVHTCGTHQGYATRSTHRQVRTKNRKDYE